MIERIKRYQNLLSFLLLMVVAYLAFWPSFAADWAMDDYLIIVNNPDIQSFAQFSQDRYPGRPLRELTYMLDYRFFGTSAPGYHLQNIFWHGMAAWLLFLLMARTGARKGLALTGALLFLLHPVTVEVVANVSHRKDSLMLVCALGATLVLMHWRQRWAHWWWGLAGAVIMYVGYLAKEPVIVLPVVIGVVLITQCRSVRIFFAGRWWVELVVWGVAAIAWGGWLVHMKGSPVFWQRVQAGMAYLGHHESTSIGLYLATVAKASAMNWSKIFYPAGLAFEYQFPPASALLLDPWVSGLIAALALLYILFRKGVRNAPLVVLGVLWFLLFQLPTSNMLWPVAYWSADRYMYAPLAGIVMMVVGLSALLRLKIPAAGVKAGSVLLLGFLAILSWRQCQVWDSERTLYQRAVAVSPDSSSALVGLAMALYNDREFDESYTLASRAARIDPYETKSLYLLGLLAEAKGDIPQAKRMFQFFLQSDGGMNPGFMRVARLRLQSYQQQGK